MLRRHKPQPDPDGFDPEDYIREELREVDQRIEGPPHQLKPSSSALAARAQLVGDLARVKAERRQTDAFVRASETTTWLTVALIVVALSNTVFQVIELFRDDPAPEITVVIEEATP